METESQMHLMRRSIQSGVQPASERAGSITGTSLIADLLECKHVFELTEADVEEVFDRGIYRQVIGSSAFQRLKKIHFLGSLDYIIDPDGPKPNKRHTRYQHSLGVARLALQFARDRRLGETEETLSVVSALLHDIGHAPLSHSLESVFKETFGIGHHVVSERIIRGDVAIGKDLNRILTRARISPFDVLMILNGVGPSPFKEIFNHGINIDTIEAISRSATYLYPNTLFRPPANVLNALMTPCEMSTAVLDNFWHLKDEVYNKLITSRVGILADYLCQRYMQDNIASFNEDQFYLTENELEERHPALFIGLRDLPSGKFKDVFTDVKNVEFIRRRFIINDSIAVDQIADINSRYQQTKDEATLRIEPH